MLAQEILARIPHGGMHDLFQRLQLALVSEHSGAKLLPIHAIGASCSRKPLFDGRHQCASWSLQSVYFRISIENRYTLSAQLGGNRPEERRVGEEWVSQCRSRWSVSHSIKYNTKEQQEQYVQYK